MIPVLRSHRHLIIAMFLSMVGALVYANTLNNGFVYDDRVVVVDDPQIRDFGHWRSIIGDPRVLKTLTFMVDYQVWGLNPFGYHLTNIVLHLLVTMTLYVLVYTMTGITRLALITSLVFAVHPIHTEVVANIANRKDALATLFVLLALLFYIKRGASGWRLGLSLTAYVLALLSKEVVGLAFLPLVVLQDLCYRVHGEGRGVQRTVRDYGPFVLVSFVGLVWLIAVKPVGYGVVNPWTLPLAEHLVTVLRAFSNYLVLLVWPLDLNADHVVERSQSVLDPAALIATAVMVTVLIVARWSHAFSRHLSFGFWWMVVAWLPISNVIPVTAYYVAERYFYLPSVGFGLAVGAVIERFLASRSPRPSLQTRYAVIVTAVLTMVVFYAWITHARNLDWRSNLVLWSKTVTQSPSSAGAHSRLGRALLEDGQRDRAIESLRESIRFDPRFSNPRVSLAILLLEQGKREEAVTELQQAIHSDPQNPWVYYNLGVIYLQQDDANRALDAFEKVVELAPNAIKPYLGMLTIDEREGRVDDAVRVSRKILELDPDHARPHSLLGSLYLRQGNVALAIQAFQEAARIEPGASTFHDLGLAYAQAGNLALAERNFREALSHDPGFAIGHYQLAIALEHLLRFREARSHYEAALVLAGSGDGRFAATVQSRLSELSGVKGAKNNQ